MATFSPPPLQVAGTLETTSPGCSTATRSIAGGSAGAGAGTGGAALSGDCAVGAAGADAVGAAGADAVGAALSGDGVVGALAVWSKGCHRTPIRRSVGRVVPFGRVIGSLSWAGRLATSPPGVSIGVTSGTSTWTPRFASDGATGRGAAGTTVTVLDGPTT